MGRLLRRLWYWIHHRKNDADLAEELEFHRDMRQLQMEQSGTQPGNANSESRKAMGNTMGAREDARAIWVWPWIENFLADFLLAVRLMSRHWLYTVTSVLLVASAVGLTTVAFGVADSTSFRKLPVHNPDQLVRVVGVPRERGTLTNGIVGVTGGIWDQLALDSEYTEQPFGETGTVIQSTIGATTRLLAASGLKGDYFTAQDGQPELGRLFGREEHEAVVVLSYRFWKNAFGADPNIVGRTLQMGASTIPIIGVAQERFLGMEPHVSMDVFMPVETYAQVLGRPAASVSGMPMEFFARLKSGMSLSQYQAYLNARWPLILAASQPQNFTIVAWRERNGERARAVSASRGFSNLTDTIPQSVTMAFGISLLIFIAGCLNLTLLAIARAVRNQRHTAIMLAIGGSRWRVMRPNLIESVLVCACGCLVALALARWGMSVGASFLPSSPTIDWRIGMTPRSVGIAVLLASVAALFGGVLPPLLTSRRPLIQVLQNSSMIASHHVWIRTSVLTAQFAMCVLLAHYALIYVGSFTALTQVDVGFKTNELHTFLLAGKSPGRVVDGVFYRAMLDRIRAIPGVKSVGLVSPAPLQAQKDFSVGIQSDNTDNKGARAITVCTFPGMIETLGLPLVSGRDFEWSDTTSAVTTRNLAQELYTDASPVGHTIQPSGMGSLRIIGVIEDLVYIRQRLGASAAVFVPCAESSKPLRSNFAYTLLVRSPRKLADLAPDIQAEIDSFGSHVVATMADERDQIAKSRQQETMLATVSGIFGGLIVVLAGLGLAGFCNYILALRTRELAIRSGLGASPRQIAGTLLRETIVVVITGSVIGLCVTLAIHKFVDDFIATNGRHYWSPMEAVLLMTVITAVATLIPTMRALRMDIARALRVE
jgi:predicted permease